MRVFIVHAHPEAKSFSGAMTRTATEALRAAGNEVAISDLYAMGFNPVSDRRNFTTVPDLSAAPLVPQTAKDAGLRHARCRRYSCQFGPAASRSGSAVKRRLEPAVWQSGIERWSNKRGGSAVGRRQEPITMLASVARDIVHSVINLTGIRQANGFLLRDGRLVLVFVDKDR